MTTAPDLLATAQRVQDLLEPTGVLFFHGSVTSQAGDDVDPEVDATTGRVKHYVVMYDSPGTGQAPALDGQVTQVAYDFQLTCVGQDINECRWVVRAVRAALSGQPVDPADDSRSGIFSESPGRRPPIQPDRDARPARWFAILLYDALVIGG